MPICLNAQIGFKNELILNIEEPNTAYHVLEHNGKYYMSGQYADTSIQSWNGYIAIYDEDGNLLDHHLVANDTLPILNVSHNVHFYEDTYNVLSVWGGFANIVTYDFALDSFYTTRKFKLSDLGVIPLSMYPDFSNQEFYFAGAFEDSLKVVKISNTDTLSFVDGENLRHRFAGSMQINSEGKLIILGEDKLRGQSSTLDSVYINILNRELELEKTNLNNLTNPQITINMNKGLTIDNIDNIVATGTRREVIETSSPNVETIDIPTIVKFDSSGTHIWTISIGNNTYNIVGKGIWKSVINTKENDGYIVVGSEAYQPEFDSDTLITRAVIAKVSNEGDSLWMRRYSWRVGAEVEDRFNDVISTSDGGYLAVGQSTNLAPNTDQDLPWIKSIIIKLNSDGLLDTSTVSTLQLNSANEIKMFPNPASDVLYLTQDSNRSLEVQIFNMNGSLMERLNLDSNSHIHILDISNYQIGSYLIQALDTSGEIFTHKLIIE